MITITAQVDSLFEGALPNIVEIAGGEEESNSANNTSEVSTQVNVAPIPDLEVQKTVEPVGSIIQGEWITYTLSYSNTGTGAATQVVITDTLDAALTNPTVSSSGAIIDLRAGSQYVWDVADLAVGEGGVITITAQVDSGFEGALANIVQIAGGEEEQNSANNTHDLRVLAR